NETLSLEDLQGEWWIADFVFTNCETVCLPMTSNMSILQDELTKENVDLQLVSFTFDPDFDTPEVLKEYGEEYHANFDTWHFLTGYDMDTIREVSMKSFRAYLKYVEGYDKIMYDTILLLINLDREIVHEYDGVSTESNDKIVTDMITLEQEGLL